MNKQLNKKQGFTIIEVVLVLAIAGLIFLMVFIALPALQRNQRDTQRRSDGGTIVSQLVSYTTNNDGAIPTTAAQITAFQTGYLSNLKDPSSGTQYTISAGTTNPSTTGTIVYYATGKCDGENLASGGTSKQAAIAIKLESNGWFCKSNL